MPDGQLKSKRLSPAKTPNKPLFSIRARLIALALLAIAPLILERLHGLAQARAARIEQAYSEVSELARRGAETQREVMASVRTLLLVIARVYADMRHFRRRH
jgi:hypothetical protein